MSSQEFHPLRILCTGFSLCSVVGDGSREMFLYTRRPAIEHCQNLLSSPYK